MNTTNFQPRKYFAVLFSILLMVIVLGLWWLIFNPPKQNKIPQVYYSALKDAQEASSNEISTKLVAIVKENPDLQWQGDRLKVATFAKAKYEYNVGDTKAQTRDLWVTAVPELKNFCTAYATTGKAITPRLEQLLGLPPGHNEPRKIVEFWVSPQDLFRPTPDPEITDHEAQLNFPESSDFITVSDQYKQWFNNELNAFNSKLKAMNPDKMPAPWTRLGYTYDWGESTDHIGLSEFVLKKTSTAEVYSTATIEDYCRVNDAQLAMN